MNDEERVKELVEQTRLTEIEIDALRKDYEGMYRNFTEHTTAIAVAQQFKVLNHPGVALIDKELPEKLTNNIGCMSKSEIEDFTTMVLRECNYPHQMEWTTAGDILIGKIIYIDKRHINEYPYMVKERVLHEVAHIDAHPQDDRHGEIFHARLVELINKFMANCSVIPIAKALKEMK